MNPIKLTCCRYFDEMHGTDGTRYTESSRGIQKEVNMTLRFAMKKRGAGDQLLPLFRKPSFEWI